MSAITQFKQIAYNRSRRTSAIKYIVVHDTGNTDKGADTERHYLYFNGGDRDSSADVFVDDHQAIQVNDWDKYYTWHCGDGHGKYGITNANSVGVEMCINSDGDYEKAFDRTVAVVKELMQVLGIDADHVVRHYDASRKDCPMSMHANNWARWNEFKRRITEVDEVSREEYNALVARVEKLEKQQDTMIYNYIDKNMPAWAHEAVKWCVDKGIIQGTGDGLGLSNTKLWVCVVMYRLAKYIAKLVGMKV